MSIDPSTLFDLEKTQKEGAFDQKDLQAQMNDLRRNYLMGKTEDQRQYGLGKSALDQGYNQRGLGWSGLKTGGEGRQLADFTSQEGQNAVQYNQGLNALQRALMKSRMETQLSQQQIMAQQMSQGLQ